MILKIFFPKLSIILAFAHFYPKKFDERASSPTYSSGFITASHEDIQENNEQDDDFSIHDDEGSSLGDILSEEEDLPQRALSAITAMKNGSAIANTTNDDDDDRFSVSDVYAFEIIEE